MRHRSEDVRRWAACSAIVSIAALIAVPARADDSAATAERLFQEARALVDKGDYAAACPKLDQSHKLDPAVGTEFNLADCYEHVGRTATAYAHFGNVASIARAAGKFDRERSARERAAALEPKLAFVRVIVKSAAPGEEVRIDDEPLKGSSGSPLPVDPGAHRLRATAPDRTAFELPLTAVPGRTIEAVVPVLVDPRPAPPPPPSSSSPQKTVAFVVGGAGVVAVGVGAAFGIIALSNRSDARSECPEDTYRFRCPTESGASAWNSASTAGTVSTIAFVAGGVALAVAGVLWLTAPRARTTASSVFDFEGRF